MGKFTVVATTTKRKSGWIQNPTGLFLFSKFLKIKLVTAEFYLLFSVRKKQLKRVVFETNGKCQKPEYLNWFCVCVFYLQSQLIIS
jgi:hypothetical protein